MKSDAQKSIADYEATRGDSRQDWPSALDQRAKLDGPECDELYKNTHWNLSLDVHALPVSLTTRSKLTGGILAVDSSPEPDEMEAQLGALIDFYLRMLEHLEQTAGIGTIAWSWNTSAK